MELQSRLAFEKKQALIGTTLNVLIEGVDEEQEVLIGRSYRDAPEIDGLAVANGIAEVGEMVEVEIEGVGPYDLFGSQV